MPKTSQPANFAGRLRSLRTAAGLSLRELAARAGIGHATIGHLETGQNATPSFATACALADALGVPVERLRAK